MTQFDLFAADPSGHRDPSAAGAPRGGDTVDNHRGYYQCRNYLVPPGEKDNTRGPRCTESATHWMLSAHYGTHTPVCLACGRAMIAEYDAKLPDDPRFRYRLQAMTPEQFAGRQPWKALDDAPGIE